MLLAISGIILMFFSLHGYEQKDIPIESVTARISMVFFIEALAYFFLRIYKQGLLEIKYFQNELTNIESKYLAIQLILGEHEKQIPEYVIQNLLQTERNPVTPKNEAKTYQDSQIKELIKRGTQLVKSKKSG